MGGIVLGQHRELSSRHIKFEVPLQCLGGKVKKGEWSSVREKSK